MVKTNKLRSVFFDVETSALRGWYYGKNKLSDRALVKDLHSLFSTTDILIAFNGDRFDIRKANNFFIRNGLKPVSVKTIDPLKIARKHFDFTSNSLNDLAEMFGIGSKIDNDKDLSFKCLNGDLKSWAKMKRYNAHDVWLLKEVFNKLAPWSNLNSIEKLEESNKCLVCDGNMVKDGVRMRLIGKRQTWICSHCGHTKTTKC